MSQPSPRALSLRTRLVILVLSLLLAVLVPMLGVTFFQVRSTLLAAGRERAQESAKNLADLFAQSTNQRLLEVRRVAASTAVRRYLLQPTPAAEAAARNELRTLAGGSSQQSLIELWNDSGERVLTVAVPASADALLSMGRLPGLPGTGPLRRVGDNATSAVVAVVERDTSAGGVDRLGYVASQRMATSAANNSEIGRLIGDRATVGLGNRAGDVWSDLTKFVAPPPVKLDAAGVAEFTAVDGQPVLAAVRPIANTPYALSVQFPRAPLVAPAAAFVGSLAAGGLGFLVIGVGLTLLVTRQITAPIAAVTDAAEHIAAGDYSSRVDVRRRDEVGRLAIAFNRMTERVQADQEAQLRSVRLEEENRRAQEATRLKSEFLANMSHELRTPLNAIIGFAELLYDEQVPPDAPEFKEFLGDILTSSKHLLQLINDVLDLAKVESGRFEFHPEPVDLTRTVNEVIGVLRTSAAAKQLRMLTAVEPDLSQIVIDPGRFKQVLYNYLSNAIKFTPAGGTVSVRISAHGPDAFRVEVDDTGIGIAPEDLDRLFVEFQQLEPGAAKKHQGTGLGLALTKRLVEAQGGSVGVESTPGTGSRFFATLPRRALGGTPLAAPRSFPAPHAGARRVLVIEDDEHDQDAIVRLLRAAGYAVDTASTAAQGLAQLQARSYDAITLDLLLPDANGIDLLRTIRGFERHRAVPVVVITVVAANGSVSAYGVSEVLTKPVDSSKLLDALRLAVAGDRNGSVLVVDDNPGSLRLMAASLGQLGYESRCVTSPAEGLRLAAEAPPLAVILDLIMPEMSGFEFLDRFRALDQCRRTPVIIWSVQDLQPEEHARLRSSVHGILSKGQHATLSVLDELRRLLTDVRVV